MKKIYFIDEKNGVNEETTEALMFRNEVYSLEEIQEVFDFNLGLVWDLPHYQIVNEIDEDVARIEEIYLPLSSIQKIYNYLSEEEIRERLEK